MNHKKTLFIFRRDLRLEDNTALMAALKSSTAVIPCFIFDPRQIGDQPYKSPAAIQFMVASLLDLQEQLMRWDAKLYFFEGQAHEILKGLIRSENIDALYINQDYTPFSRQRDRQMMDVCVKANIPCHSFHDALLNAPDIVKKADGGVYTVFTPYCRKAMTYDVPEPLLNRGKNYYKSSISLEKKDFLNAIKVKITKETLYPGGRGASLKILSEMKGFKDYHEQRNIPHLKATTKLSAHNKFGTNSIREVYQAVRNTLGLDHTLIRELYWRDFFTQIGYHFPHVWGGAFHAKYDAISWENNLKHFQAWCEGQTGFPIVDAGMRELNQTGFMHNRVRMITASFLVKDLHIDWRWGEKYFASKLVDYDPLVNNGNWQWAASTGCDAQPYFRIFNPWLQQEKFDPQGAYIKEWVPELNQGHYPKPMVDHKLEAQRAIGIYRSI